MRRNYFVICVALAALLVCNWGIADSESLTSDCPDLESMSPEQIARLIIPVNCIVAEDQPIPTSDPDGEPSSPAFPSTIILLVVTIPLGTN